MTRNGKTFSVIPSLGISVNQTCDMRCVYCPPNGEDIIRCETFCDVASIKSLLEIAKERDVSVVRLTGGEPLLVPKRAHEILRRACQLGFQKIIFNTNGTRLRAELEWLTKYAGQFECKISLDSLSRPNFEKITGVDALANVLDSIHEAKGKLKITINLVVTKFNRNEILEILDFCEFNGFDAKIFDVFDFTGVFHERWKQCFCCIDDLIGTLEARYERVGRERLPGGRGIAMDSFKLGANRLLVVNHHGKGRSTRVFSSFCRTCPNFPCASGRFQMALRSDGLLSPCRLRPDFGHHILGLNRTEIELIVDKELEQFEHCTYE